MTRILTLILACTFLAACGGGANGSGFSSDGPVTNAGWTTSAMEYRGQNGVIVGYECAPNPDRVAVGTVWGTGTYSDDSSVCAAGVHAGAITFAKGGVVVFEALAGQESYTGSNQNGVESANWPSWQGSFSILQ